MKKVRCLLVDDEPWAITLLQKHISQLDFMEVAATATNAIKALELLKLSDIDLLFPDEAARVSALVARSRRYS